MYCTMNIFWNQNSRGNFFGPQYYNPKPKKGNYMGPYIITLYYNPKPYFPNWPKERDRVWITACKVLTFRQMLRMQRLSL